MIERRMKVAIGGFVLMGILLLAVLVVLFGGKPTLFKAHNRYIITLSNAAGVAPGTPVRKAGVPIGTVESVQLDDSTGLVKIVVLIDKNVTIWDNEEAVLNSGLLGDTTLEIVPRESRHRPGAPAELQLTGHVELVAAADPPPPRKPLEPGSEIPGRVPPSPQRLLDEVSRVLPSTQQAVLELGRAAETFNRIAPSFDAAIREAGALARDARDALPELRRTNDELQIAARNWGAAGERVNVLLATNEDKIVQTLQDIDDTVQRIGKAFSNENLRNLETILKNTRAASDRFPSIAENGDELLREAQASMADLRRMTQPLGDRSDRITRNLEEGSERFNKVMADVQELLQVINRRDGTVQRLISDPSLYNNLNDIVCQVGRMMPRLERALKDLEVFTDKIARHPESLGVGGAVRPSSGLK